MQYKLPKKFTPVVFAFYMSAIMALLMCIVIVAINTGVSGNYFDRVLHAYALAMPIAFLVLQVVRPVVLKLVEVTVCRT
ncbi:DUF2798 domain-containing protein [Methylophilus aquaticus]|uniref:DUF2798 domain-containing protein n=1 Tax=Methylophilus aquaticus TaxID=1971610 RepID=A0ABT9JS49_9PROT|nr:DUF2798 domain-containing protein [Methylophilus aquaticus]MDP8567407.1 DUF2798 domain-containing protein [Methylophilus aquaticus]